MTSKFDINTIKQRLAQQREELRKSLKNSEPLSSSSVEVFSHSSRLYKAMTSNITSTDSSSTDGHVTPALASSSQSDNNHNTINDQHKELEMEKLMEEAEGLLDADTITITRQVISRENKRDDVIDTDPASEQESMMSATSRIREKYKIKQQMEQKNNNHFALESKENDLGVTDDNDEEGRISQIDLATDRRERKSIIVDQSIDNEFINAAYKETSLAKQEKLLEAVDQVKKLEDAILLSEQREEELRLEKQRSIDREKTKLREMTHENDHLRKYIDDMKNETDELTKQFHDETRKQNDLMQQIEQKKISSIKELENIVEYFNKEAIQNNMNQQRYDHGKSELRKKIEILEKKEMEKNTEIQEKTVRLQELQSVEADLMLKIRNANSDEAIDKSQEQTRKILELQKQKAEIVLDLERHRRSYPLEVSLVEKQEEYETLMSQFSHYKEELVNQLKDVQSKIEELHEELKKREEENGLLRTEFNFQKKQEEEVIDRLNRKYEASKKFVKMKETELTNTENLLSQARQIHEEFRQDILIQIRIVENEIVVLNEELERFGEEKASKMKKMYSDLCYAVIEADKLTREFKSYKCELTSLGDNMSPEVLDAFRGLKLPEGLREEASFEGDVVRLITDHVNNEIDSEFYNIHKEALHKYASLIISESDRSRSSDVTSQALILSKKSFSPLILDLEQRADLVIRSRFRIPKIIEYIEKTSLDIEVQKEILNNWGIVLTEKQQELTIQLNSARDDMEPILDSIQQNMTALQEQINNASRIVNVNFDEVTSRRQELKNTIEQERLRLDSFGQLVSQLEGQINSLFIEKRSMEQSWDSMIAHEKDFEVMSQEERSKLQEALANQYKSQTSLEVTEAGKRLTSFTMLVHRLSQINILIEQERKQAQSIGEGTTVEAIIESHDKIQLDVKETQNMIGDTQNELETLNSELSVISTEHRRLESHFRSLESEEQHNCNRYRNEMIVNEAKRDELVQIISHLEAQERILQDQFEQSSLPLKLRIERNRKEIARLTTALLKQRQDLTVNKSHIDAIEARYSSEISKVRGQRQVFRHRLDLKLKAIDNMKSLVPQSSSSAPTKKSATPATKTPKMKSYQSEDKSYFKMYIRKKDPEGKNTFDAYDQELHDALLNGQDSLLNISDYSRVDIPYTSVNLQNLSRLDEEMLIVGYDEAKARKGMIKLFGPQTKALTEKEAQNVVEKIQFMCNGSLLHKRKEKHSMVPNNGKGCYDIRHVSLSPELTRLQIRDKKKKIPESFIKIEHIMNVRMNSRLSSGEFSFSLILRDRKIDFLTFEEQDFQLWIEGIEILVENKQHLFSLKYNMKDILVVH